MPGAICWFGGVIPADLVADAVREIAAYVGADLDDRESWQHPALYDLFAEFFAMRELRVDINRCIFRPPVNNAHPFISHCDIHWDANPLGDLPEGVQTVILLSPIRRDSGGFQCIPAVYRDLDRWLDQNARVSALRLSAGGSRGRRHHPVVHEAAAWVGHQPAGKTPDPRL